MRTRELNDGREKGWWWAENALIDDGHMAKMGPYAWIVFCVLMRLADDRGESFPSISFLQHRTGLSRQGVVNAIKILLAGHYIGKLQTGGRDLGSNRYSVRNAPAIAPSTEPLLFTEPEKKEVVNGVDQLPSHPDALEPSHSGGLSGQPCGVPSQPGAGGVVNRADCKKTYKKKTYRRRNTSSAADAAGGEHPKLATSAEPLPTAICYAVRDYWNEAWKRTHHTDFCWGSGGTVGNALASVMQTLGCRRESSPEGETKLTREERLARNAHNAALLPKVRRVIDAYMSETGRFYEGHPPTKLMSNIHHFIAKADGKSPTGSGREGGYRGQQLERQAAERLGWNRDGVKPINLDDVGDGAGKPAVALAG